MAFNSFSKVSRNDRLPFLRLLTSITGWANNPAFPFKEPKVPGFDPIIGQGGKRAMSGTDPKNQDNNLDLPREWVVSRGGEYFFSPSIPALKGKFAAA